VPGTKPRVNKRSSDEAVKAATGSRGQETDAPANLEVPERRTKCRAVVGPDGGRGIRTGARPSRFASEMHRRILRVSQQNVAGLYRKSLCGVDRGRPPKRLARRGEDGNQHENRQQILACRMGWHGGKGRLSVNSYAKGPEKTQVAVDHMKLANSKECTKMKSYWFEALNRLEAVFGA
jgi:hypothetical protein